MINTPHSFYVLVFWGFNKIDSHKSFLSFFFRVISLYLVLLKRKPNVSFELIYTLVKCTQFLMMEVIPSVSFNGLSLCGHVGMSASKQLIIL